MRSDYALYMVAIIFFILTGISAFILAESERPLWVVTTTVLGLFFIGLGYTQRPKPMTRKIEAPPVPVPTPPPTPAQSPEPTPVAVASPTSTATEVVEEKAAIVTEVAPPEIELTKVKGIGMKRADQLKALGITSINGLANASANNLAEKLKISPRITAKWIESAKELVEKS